MVTIVGISKWGVVFAGDSGMHDWQVEFALDSNSGNWSLDAVGEWEQGRLCICSGMLVRGLRRLGRWLLIAAWSKSEIGSMSEFLVGNSMLVLHRLQVRGV